MKGTTEVKFVSKSEVELVDWMGSDESIIAAARVSVLGSRAAEDTSGSAGLIDFLMRNRHGTPFEHTAMTFRIAGPIFMWREFMRHRIGFSYNEESGRYKQLEPVFYVPSGSRPLVQVGKAGQYSFVPGPQGMLELALRGLEDTAVGCYAAYESMLEAGVAREVARMCLPLNIVSSAYVTCNARSLMSFLSLRTRSESARFPSFPQYEMEQVARDMEIQFGLRFGSVHEAFCVNGRVSP